ncbi:MAG TPA: hypothetical protein VMU50_12835, partial [Polyangia bacterium]|nr:hypothetical protein [Polyangia bacterium]
MATTTSPAAPRTLLFSQRHMNRMVYQCSKYEFEDVIGEVDAVEMLAPPLPVESPLRALGRRAANRALRALDRAQIATMNPVAVGRRYDLFFASFLFPEETLYLEKIAGWREQARYAACFLGEVWTKDAERLRRHAPILKQFDHIFLHVGASASLVASVTGRPCHLIHVGVDAIRFCPHPNPPERVIDCYSFGRRSKPVHEALLRLVESGERRFFYVHDTVNNFAVDDPLAHRRLTAELIKRARYFIAFKHNLNAANQTGGDEALGSRLYEGAAGGAIVLGVAPDCPEFATQFDWPDALIPIPFDAADMQPILRELDAQAPRLARARTGNVL